MPSQSIRRFTGGGQCCTHERSGEAVKVVVVRQDPALTESQLLAHCKLHLTRYKMPRIVEFRSEPLPKSNIGKILRRELRDGGAVVSAGSAPAAV